MLCCIGDLVEDIVVRISSDVARGTDTEAVISRRQGGSAANVAVRASVSGSAVRFLGRVGSDAIGGALIAGLVSSGIDTRVQREGRTGTIVVLVDEEGERSMLPDRGAAVEYDGGGNTDLEDVTWLHVPAYSLVTEPLATASRSAIKYARVRGAIVSVDASSTAIISEMGLERFKEMIEELKPDVVFCNVDEGALLEVEVSGGLRGVLLTVVKDGAGPVIAYMGEGETLTIPATKLGDVYDTTGAGDAFAAGFITEMMSFSVKAGEMGVSSMKDHDLVCEAIESGHRFAAELLTYNAS